VELSRNQLYAQEVFVSHANAALTPRARLRLARLVIDDGWPIARAADLFQVSWPTAKRWADRYRDLGLPGMADRSSRPHHQPNKTRCRLHRLSHLDRHTGETIRRYEHPHPGAMLHVDVKKLGNIPDGGGWRYVGKAHGYRNRAATAVRTGQRNIRRQPNTGTAFVHTVIDDHSRVAYAEIHNDETAATATAVLRNAVTWFTDRGITIERVLSDNGSAYRSHLWRDTCTELGITPKKTRPYRPQTNGKIERFHRTLADGWAFKQLYPTEQARRAALPAWLHHYNHHRPHTAIGKVPPITRLTNLPGQYS
jgi:transposase InsO family protein